MLRSRFLLVAFAAVATTTFATKPAHADARVQVPFSFTVEGKQCPPGRYIVKGDAGSNTVTLIGRGSRVFSWIVVPTSVDRTGKEVVLRFDQSGSEHSLRSIQYGAQSTSRIDDHARQSDEMDEMGAGGR